MSRSRPATEYNVFHQRPGVVDPIQADPAAFARAPNTISGRLQYLPVGSAASNHLAQSSFQAHSHSRSISSNPYFKDPGSRVPGHIEGVLADLLSILKQFSYSVFHVG